MPLHCRPVPPSAPLRHPQISQLRLQARGREYAAAAAQLAQVQRDLAQFAGLPADADAARAATAAKRQELERLRRQLQEHLSSMDG